MNMSELPENPGLQSLGRECCFPALETIGSPREADSAQVTQLRCLGVQVAMVQVQGPLGLRAFITVTFKDFVKTLCRVS